MQTHLQQSLVISYCSYFEGLKGTYTITCKTGIFTKEKKTVHFLFYVQSQILMQYYQVYKVIILKRQFQFV
jgi:hypothetical protein